jgi:hypothetical protein
MMVRVPYFRHIPRPPRGDRGLDVTIVPAIERGVNEHEIGRIVDFAAAARISRSPAAGPVAFHRSRLFVSGNILKTSSNVASLGIDGR